MFADGRACAMRCRKSSEDPVSAAPLDSMFNVFTYHSCTVHRTVRHPGSRAQNGLPRRRLCDQADSPKMEQTVRFVRREPGRRRKLSAWHSFGAKRCYRKRGGLHNAPKLLAYLRATQKPKRSPPAGGRKPVFASAPPPCHYYDWRARQFCAALKHGC